MSVETRAYLMSMPVSVSEARSAQDQFGILTAQVKPSGIPGFRLLIPKSQRPKSGRMGDEDVISRRLPALVGEDAAEERVTACNYQQEAMTPIMVSSVMIPAMTTAKPATAPRMA